MQIVPANQPRRAAVAWFVAGSDPQVWLATIKASGLSPSSIVLRPIPCSLQDRSLLGVLFSCDAKTTPKSDNPPTGFPAIPYGCISRRLFLPVDADLVPQPGDQELGGLLPSDRSDFIWHPSVGLVRCEPEERLRVVDLVQPPRRIASNWNLAVPGISFRTRLLSVEPAIQPSVDDILQSARQDIGGNSSSLNELPPAPGEGLSGQIYDLTKPIRDAWRSLKNWSKSAHQKSPPPQGNASGGQAGASGWGVLQWLGGAMAPFVAAAAALNRAMPKSFVNQEARVREIDRLLHLLKSDPDAGLRFALPLGGTEAGRGVAAPSNQLLPRDINFGLGRLAGGGPVDAWNIPVNQQYQLILKYRELAAREIQMGRHRRAAYIFAELLGDIMSAAGALESGRHYREAAVLYRDRLKRPHDAARCLEQGGLLDEAAELYAELGMMENAADLYVRLERPDEAERLLRCWVDQLQQKGDYLKASDVLNRKLKDIDASLLILESGWSQQGASADACLKQVFGLLNQHSRHQAAHQRVLQLRDDFFELPRVPQVARVLSGVATGYPDQAVRQEASDATRVIVARQLRSSKSAEANVLLGSIIALAPQDRLLTRDCSRFVRHKESQSRRAAKPVRRTTGISLVNSVKLNGVVDWRGAKSSGEALYAWGFIDRGLVVRRIVWLSDWKSHYDDVYWANIGSDHRILLEVASGNSERILVHAVGQAPLDPRSYPSSDAISASIQTAGSPNWATASTVAFSCSDNGTFGWRIRAVFGTLELAGFGPRSEEVTNGLLRIGVSEDALPNVPVCVCSGAKPIRISVGRIICRPLFGAQDEIDADAARLAEQFVELESEVESLHNFRDNATDCIVALFDAGGVMIPEPIHENRPVAIAEGIESPVGVFLTDGVFVVAGSKECRAYRFIGTSVQKVGQMTLDSPAVAVTRTHLLGQFAILHADGKVQVFKLDQ